MSDLKLMPGPHFSPAKELTVQRSAIKLFSSGGRNNFWRGDIFEKMPEFQGASKSTLNDC